MSTMPAGGAVTLTDPETARHDCVGRDGFQDIGPFTQVLLFEDGRLVGFTALGRAVGSANGRTCTWTWSMTGVPRGGGVYSLEIGARGAVTFTRHQLSVRTASVRLRRP